MSLHYQNIISNHLCRYRDKLHWLCYNFKGSSTGWPVISQSTHVA